MARKVDERVSLSPPLLVSLCRLGGRALVAACRRSSGRSRRKRLEAAPPGGSFRPLPQPDHLIRPRQTLAPRLAIEFTITLMARQEVNPALLWPIEQNVPQDTCTAVKSPTPSCELATPANNELDAASLASGRCAHCGAAIRTVAQRTVEDKKLLHQPPRCRPMATEDSIDLDCRIPAVAGATGMTLRRHARRNRAARRASRPPSPIAPTMTIEFQPPEPPIGRRLAARDSAATIDSADFPSPRRTHRDR